MRLLLDTHVLLWSALTPKRIRPDVRTVLEDGENEILASVVSAWEIAIKQSLGKLTLVRPAERWLPDVLAKMAITPLPVSLGAALRVRALPWLHRDPFDRLLAAQALDEGVTVVTHDDVFVRYGVPVIPT